MSSKLKSIFDNKIVFVLIGLFNILVFHFAIFRLWFFLFDSSNRNSINSTFLALIINSLLIIFFSAPHSLLLTSKVKKYFFTYIPKKLYSTFYSLHACLGIILMDTFWVNIGDNLYEWPLFYKTTIFILYVLSWLFMLWSMIATGLFRQSGIEEWWLALKNKSIKKTLLNEGPYKICRHPIYAAFLGMIWFTPNMSIDRLYLAISWTIYIFIGASLKEKRLKRNSAYIEYSKNVPLLPLKVLIFLISLILIGPLQAKELSQKFEYKNFVEAKKSKNRLQFIVESTKAGLFSSDVDGYVKSYSYSADLDEKNQILRNMKIIIKTISMDSDNESRDNKLHNLCLSHQSYPSIEVSLNGPFFLKSSRSQKLKGIVKIRGKEKDFEIELSSQSEKNRIIVSGKSTWSLKKMEIPDPSILVAKLSDDIRINILIDSEL